MLFVIIGVEEGTGEQRVSEEAKERESVPTTSDMHKDKKGQVSTIKCYFIYQFQIV